MNANRRQFLQVTATSVAAAATCSTNAVQAGDPFAPAEPGLLAKWFDKGKQHVLPKEAFASAPVHTLGSPTPRPAMVETWLNLSGGASHNSNFQPYKDWGAEQDILPIGKVFHGTAVEWNGDMVGGNFKYDKIQNPLNPWMAAPSAWSTMRGRVEPDVASGDYGIADKGNWGKFGDQDIDGKGSLVRCYKVQMREALLKVPGLDMPPTLCYTYEGMVPGPTFRFRHGMPAVVRFENRLQTETSIHHHGGHNPTHGDGFPSYYVLQGEARDYLYPNILPLRINEKGETEIDFGEGQSTTWYHDHGLDATAFNVSHGLSGLALWYDELELKLIREGVLPGLGAISSLDPEIAGEKEQLAAAWAKMKVGHPDSDFVRRHNLALEREKKREKGLENGANDPDDFQGLDAKHYYPEMLTPYFNPYELPIVLQDRVFNKDTGQIVYDSNAHNGYIGNTQLITGQAWPVVEVKARKYRLRILDGSNARIYRLRFLDSETFKLQPTADGTGSKEPRFITEAALESESKEFYRIGKDSWLFPTPQVRKSLIINMAGRADLVVDFGAWYKAAKAAGKTVNGKAEFYLVNTMPQFDGRGPKSKLAEDAGDPAVFPLPFTLNPADPVVANMVADGVVPAAFLGAGPLGQVSELNQPIGLIKFIVTGDDIEDAKIPDASIVESTILRPRHAIKDEEVMAVREFSFERGKGAWMINSRFYDPTISNASTVIGIKGQEFEVPSDKPIKERKQSLEYSEEWILRNGGGGWWHPIHIHLEGHQLVAYEKDFEADGLIGADGILGARAQTQMAGLPDWFDLVGKYGFHPLLRSGSVHPDLLRRLRDLLSGIPFRELLGKKAILIASPPPLPEALSQIQQSLLTTMSTATESEAWFDSLSAANRRAIAAWLFGDGAMLKDFFKAELSQFKPLKILIERPGAGASLFPLLKERLDTEIKTLTVPEKRILDGLEALRLQWAGEMVGNHDTALLGPNTIARIRMRFRTWSGPLVFHCHNVEHEDMRMMVNFEATMSGLVRELNKHDPNIVPTQRTHGQDMTDLLTNPNAVGEMPWDAIDGFPHYRWNESPVPATPVTEAGKPLIAPREKKK